MSSRRKLGQRWRWIAAMVAIGLAAALAIGLAAAPELFPYALRIAEPLHVRLMPPPVSGFDPLPGPAVGRVVDGYWLVQQIAPGTYAIGEPADAPDNYEYLLVGSARSLLIDAGSSQRDIHPALAGLTTGPVTVIPTHLHSDHTNGLRFFDHIALVDLPETRGQVRDGSLHLAFREYLAPMRQAPVFRVNDWVKPGGTIELGGRSVTLLSTPGHTATSISISDAANKLLFTGDLIYPTSLYAFMPDSSLSAYVGSLRKLLTTLPSDTRIYGAHCCRNDAPPEAPWLSFKDLADTSSAIQAVEAGQAHGGGFLLRRFPVNSRMTLITFYPFGDH